MALRFILGKAGSGKTTHCMDDIAALVNSEKFPLYYIVPEQYTLEAEKSLVNKFAYKAVIKAQVLSFERLSFHVLSETGARQGNVLDSTGKSMVIRKILHDIAPKLKYYHKTPVSAGFVKSVSLTIRELYQQEASGESLAPAKFSTVYQASKFEDVRLIFESYKAFVENEYISSDTSLDILNQNIVNSKLFRGAIIWIDNFTGFTAQEYRVIENLLKMADTVNVCVNLANRSTNYTNPLPEDVYYESKFLISKLTTIAKENNIEILADKFLDSSYRFKNSPELNWLLENYESNRPMPYAGKNERVSLCSFPDKYLEAKAVADNIIQLVRDRGLNFNEIAVLPGDMPAYSPILQNTFERYNIPCFFDLRIGILFHPLTEFVRTLFEVIMKNWSYESVFRLLKTDLLDIEENEIDLLENYVIEYGIRGSKWKHDEWKYGFGKNSPYGKTSIHNTKKAVYDRVSEFTNGYTPKGKIKPADVCRDIYNYLLKLRTPEKLTRLSMDAAEEGNMYLYRIHSGIWNILMAVLEKITDIFDNAELAKMTTAEFADILFMGLSSCDMGIIPPSQDQVIVGDIYRSRLNNIKAVFIIGMTGELIPKRAESEGLLDDNDKAFLENSGIELGTNTDKQTYINSHTIFGVLTKASDYLFLYYPEKDTSGKTSSPSPLLWKIKQLFHFDVKGRESKAEKITLPKPMLEELGEHLNASAEKEPVPDEFGAALISWYSDSDAFANQMRKTSSSMPNIRALSYEALDSLYKKDMVTSVSRIERYVECPFSYFLRYNLKIKERADYRVRNVDLGNIFHEALELFTAHLHTNSLDWGGMGYSEIDKIVEELFVGFAEKGKSDIFTYDAKTGYVLEQVKKISKRSIWALGSHIKSGNFKPLAAEVSFDSDAGITVDINDRFRFMLTGRIDRVDLMERSGETYVKIIDYKSGAKKLDITDVYYGRQLQLLTYMGALASHGDKILGIVDKPKPGGLFYFKFDNPIAEYNENVAEGDIYKNILGQFKMSGLTVKDNVIIEGIDSNIAKSSAIISVNLDKNGEYTSRSEALVSKAEFEHLINFTRDKISEIGRKIISGNIEAKPYKRGMRSGCDYCPYISVCGFNENGANRQYNYFRKVKNLGELK